MLMENSEGGNPLTVLFERINGRFNYGNTI